MVSEAPRHGGGGGVCFAPGMRTMKDMWSRVFSLIFLSHDRPMSTSNQSLNNFRSGL